MTTAAIGLLIFFGMTSFGVVLVLFALLGFALGIIREMREERDAFRLQIVQLRQALFGKFPPGPAASRAELLSIIEENKPAGVTLEQALEELLAAVRPHRR